MISYDRLLEAFWEQHDPASATGSTQYRNAVFFGDAEQRRAAEASRDRVAARTGSEVRTALLPLDRFWSAEDYHQKYYLRGSPWNDDLRALFPGEESFIASTAAARVNAYVGRDLSFDELKRELAALGLEARGEERLTEVVRPGGPAR